MNDGGPAFPTPETTELVPNGDEFRNVKVMESSGMSLRDYFAAFALLGEYLREVSGQTNSCGPYSGRATSAYRQADAMIEQSQNQL